LNTLEQDMLTVMRDTHLGDSQKLHKYVSLLRSYILYSDKLSKYEQEPVPVVVVRNQQQRHQQQQTEQEYQQPAPVQPFTMQTDEQQEDADTSISMKMPTNVREKVLGKLIGIYRERAIDLLDQLSNMPQFKYNELDGIITIGKKPLSKHANLSDLISRFVKEQSGLPVIAKIPVSYAPFKTFVNKMGINVVNATTPTRTTSSSSTRTTRTAGKIAKRTVVKKGEGKWLTY
jgi:hypothetical protein